MYLKNLLLCVLVGFGSLHAQEEISSFFYPNLLQSGQINPAYHTEDRFNIGLASTYFQFDLRGPKLSEFANSNKYLRAFGKGLGNNSISNDMSFNYFDIAFHKKGWDFRLGYNGNFSAYFNFSPDLARLLGQGNANELDKTFDLGPELFIRNVNELYLGFSAPIYEYYRLGFNLKILNGSFDISTRRSVFEFYTDSEYYALEFNNDYLINTSYNELEFSIKGLNPIGQPLQDNIGISGDFGFQYFGENWTASLSVLDVGFINWKSNPKNYTSEGQYNFEGFKIEDFSRDSLAVEWEEVKELFDVEETDNVYRTFAPIKFYAGAEYRHDRWTFGGLIYSEWKQQRVLPAFAVNAKTELWKFWDVGMSYAVKNKSYSNLGLSSIMNLGPIQLYALSDNVISIFMQKSQTKINFRVGANINIAHKKIIPNANKA